jgi:hypothetical protein
MVPLSARLLKNNGLEVVPFVAIELGILKSVA